MQFYRLLFFSYSFTLFLSCRQPENNNVSPRLLPTDSLQENNPYVKEDISPMDMSWYPVNYPIEKMKGNDTLKLIARVTYGRPHKKGRQIFGDAEQSLCAYGKPWRLGANEATELTLFENVSIAGKNVDKGTYVMYCIPHADRWTITLNSNLYTWGLQTDESKDVLKTDVPVMPQSPLIENFTMVFQNTDTGADLLMAWDNVKTLLPLTFAK